MGVVVETGCGKLEGCELGGLHAFCGIPYAKPPLGALRFAAPQPGEPWSGVRDAGRFGPSAPQAKLDFDLVPGLDVGAQSEDCLTLNVWTPAADAARRPVLVWIHGGAFTSGSGSQGLVDLRPLARRGEVVAVSLNYRLGALGFLHLADLPGDSRDATGNAGILDQVAALAWVRANIQRFGGDPDNVTIFGESAGGDSVGTLLGTPSARGLFQRAVAQSGAAHDVHGRDAATALARELLRELELSPDALERLWDVPVEALLAAQEPCFARARRAGRQSFQPVVDGDALPEPPLEAVRRGLARDVPLLVGTARDEEKLFGFLDPQLAKLDEAGLLERVEARVPGRGRALVDAYRAARAGRAAVEPRELYFAIESDRKFRIPAVRLAEAQAEHQRTYAYLFTWESPLMDGALGACHGVDVPFVFGAIGSKGADRFVGGGPEAEALCARTMDAWLAFARGGDPNGAGLPDWPAYDSARRATMLLGRRCELADAPLDEERRAWDGVL